MTAVRAGSAVWVAVCPLARLPRERGVAALVGSAQVAVFRTFDDEVYATGNQDPFAGAYVLARGIVGTRAGVPTVASPLHKQVFDLRTGACLDDPAVRIPVYRVRVSDGVVEIAQASR
ncbi:MAG: nitrite reductase small subunit NirD [Actinomycetota bacterium]|nr:nitrite reductase small subunit NirD [Actinomycetota bacterium]